ncbi:hypothetical protein PSQ19_06150 [Devosia algicola]|uniref:Uncharacterized protein n=1 Tax=Devosia algicola TaxID=3026418 RepID=A0ABY7YQP6_9HYPH|nr:hypothetical protein [Devosia algicola]WDR03650.1 hypothetical protein PSQ19_06150 [Devosia algicola]
MTTKAETTHPTAKATSTKVRKVTAKTNPVDRVAAPVVPADEAFGNVLIAQRDTAVCDEQALRSQLTARDGKYERDDARLKAEYFAESTALHEQIARQVKIIEATDAALKALGGGVADELQTETTKLRMVS